jgi:crotonobetainyl-CoA:carnitine CoA-transferase CaiB-like acyl-CoA transferase
VLTGAINDSMWPRLCEALHLEGLKARADLTTNAGRVRYRQEVEACIAQACATQSTEYWLGRLRERGLLAAPIRTVGAAVTDPGTRAMNLFVELTGYADVVAPRLDNVPTHDSAQSIPLLGEHTSSVLQDLLGMSANTVEQLARQGVVHVAPDVQGKLDP